MNNMGLVNAARQIQSYGRGADTQLAHISPDESQFIDYMQGGRKENPHTGLPEYSSFGNLLKIVARVAGGVGGFMVGGPAGAAAGSAAATKLTGGSWKDALKSGALSGAGGFLGQGLGGGTWSAFGDGTPLANAFAGTAGGVGEAAGSAVGSGLSGEAGLAGDAFAAGYGDVGTGLSNAAGIGFQAAPTALSAPVTTSLLGGSAMSTPLGGVAGGWGSGVAPAATAGGASSAGGLAGALSHIGGWGGLGAGVGSLAMPLPVPGMDQPASSPGININAAPLGRKYQPFTGDYATYGQPGNSGWQFFDEINPKPKFLARGGAVRGYAMGGGVMPLDGPGNGLGGLGALRSPGIPSQLEAPHFDDGMQMRAQAQNMSPMSQRDNLRNAAKFGFMNAANGGAIHGPGDGQSDSIPAMLSNNEHVFDASVVSDAGSGDPDAGHQVMEKIKAEIRRRAGRKHPRKATPKQSASPRGLVAMAMK